MSPSTAVSQAAFPWHHVAACNCQTGHAQRACKEKLGCTGGPLLLLLVMVEPPLLSANISVAHQKSL